MRFFDSTTERHVDTHFENLPTPVKHQLRCCSVEALQLPGIHERKAFQKIYYTMELVHQNQLKKVEQEVYRYCFLQLHEQSHTAMGSQPSVYFAKQYGMQ
ncbi:hypothetical protein HNR37_000296 [Desulfurispira natronophila]|uniref:Uncharacterized protein n=1 Tax=Desulfurispira natronophila TaxID=682562 RepID=A0A7W7Y2T0_9BACT|nr:hypothetical protein [Desulfurispira natronophila]